MAGLLIIGASGQVGRELCRRAGGRAVTAVDRSRLDITSRDAIRDLIRALRPDVVINAAAYTAVDRAEAEPDAAHAANAQAPGHMAEACAEYGAALLHISTDYVFDGSGVRPWREDDPVAPMGVYSVSKAEGEKAVRAALDRHVILRTAWVVSPFGNNFVKTMLRLAGEREELRVVADQMGGPTVAADIADALLTIADWVAVADDSRLFGTFHFCGGPCASWHEFATEIVRLGAAHGGRCPRVSAITTADYPTPAKRPVNSRLDCGKIEAVYGITQPDWRRSVAGVVAELMSAGGRGMRK